MRFPFLRFGLILAAVIVLLSQADNIAQQPPPVVPPTAPSIGPVGTGGTQRGTTATLTLAGTNLVDPLTVWTSFPAKSTIPLDDTNGRTPTSLKVQVTPQADAPIGFHWMRVTTAQGISNFR